ncbi:hypothetical protein J7J13_00820 [bacterium]|nr:hypothetical protein [bacterium]
MFKHNKNKKTELKTQTGNGENDNVVFHTMQDDLRAMDGKIILNEKEGSKDIEETEPKKENKRVSPFSSNAFKKPNYSSSPASSSRDKFSIMPENPNAKGAGLSALTNNHNTFKNNHAILGEKNKNKKKKTILSFLIPVIIILIIVSVALGSYLLWKTGNTVETVVAPPTEIPTEEPEPTETPIEKYSSENPNYLSIDTESATSEDISQLLIQTASEIKEFKSDGPFEFIVTDANNNPLSFSIFAYLSKINLSSETLNSLGESFSLYFYTDNENVRLGIVANIQDTEAISSEMSGEESALANGLQPLFLGSSFSETGKSFSVSQYKDFQIRYINLDEQNTLSVDYSIIGNQLVIGTSKITARAIIDRIETEQSENSTAEENSVDIEL